jgi:GNAT superfamily N-acetyltransferase
VDPVPAVAADVDDVVETVALAFAHDPVWSVALARADGDLGHVRPFWRVYVEGALRHGTVFLTEGAATVSVWLPPGGSELSEEQEEAAVRLVESALEPASARAMVELWDRFDENHPRDVPHAYLSLLATHPAAAGSGLGQRHLVADLARWDALGVPTYLESSNPANNHRYERHGFVAVGGFETVLDAAPVTTMWRGVVG